MTTLKTTTSKILCTHHMYEGLPYIAPADTAESCMRAVVDAFGIQWEHVGTQNGDVVSRTVTPVKDTDILLEGRGSRYRGQVRGYSISVSMTLCEGYTLVHFDNPYPQVNTNHYAILTPEHTLHVFPERAENILVYPTAGRPTWTYEISDVKNVARCLSKLFEQAECVDTLPFFVGRYNAREEMPVVIESPVVLRVDSGGRFEIRDAQRKAYRRLSLPFMETDEGIEVLL